MKKRIAIIGAGLSGLTLANHLKNHAEIVVFEKARGVGGRMSTRYAEPYFFDHGAQFITARDARFQEFLKPHIASGLIAEWQGKVITMQAGKKITKRPWFEPHWVASPHMNSLCKVLAEGMDVRLSVEVAPLMPRASEVWTLQDKAGQVLGEFDWVISTAPPAQTTKLLGTALPETTRMHHVRMQGCYTLMLGFNTPWDKQWIAAKVLDNPIEWIAINSTKPGRDKAVTAIVVHSSNDWADAHIDDDLPTAQSYLEAQLEAVSGISPALADYRSLHRWKYALVTAADGGEVYIDPAHGVAATSDWVSPASRIEEVWLHASSLAEKMIRDVL